MKKKMYFENSKGNRLCGILSNPTDETSKPVIILCHGFFTGKDSFTNSNLEQILNKEKISTFRFDFFGHGESEGSVEDITLSEAVDDILEAIECLKEEGYSKIALVGSSFGGAASIMAASQSNDLFALALKAPVPDYKEHSTQKYGEDSIREWKERGYRYIMDKGKKYKFNYTFFEDYDNNNGYKAAEKIKIPTLIVHGDMDKSVSIERVRKISSFIKDCELVEFKNCGHEFDKPGEFNRMLTLISDFIIKQSKKG